MVEGHFAEACERRGLKLNVDKSKVIVFGGMEELVYEVTVESR